MTSPLDGMTQGRWDSLSSAARDAIRDESGLCSQLKGLEGRRVRVTPGFYGERSATFTVGRSTGWRPCHLAVRRGARGSSRVLTENTVFRTVQEV